MSFPFPLATVVAVFCALALAGTGSASSLLRPGDRIVFIGDSITGQGDNVTDGWIHQMKNALRAASPENRQTFVALGGSGQGAGTWLDVERRSRSQNFPLDVRAHDVKAALDQPADVLVIMLGMNDALFPRVEETPSGMDRWAGDYEKLLRILRERTRPRLVALATPTLCTEDVDSPKNRVLAGFAGRIGAIAKQENCVVLPTREEMIRVLARGRQGRPDFHVTGDFVHPDLAGHVAIARGMLRGLGETQAADALLKKHSGELFSKQPLSWNIRYEGPASGPPSGELTSGKLTARLAFFRNAASLSKQAATLRTPAGWRVVSAGGSDRRGRDGEARGEFVITGSPDRLVSTLVLSADGHQAAIRVPAPWLIGTGNAGREGWEGDRFNPSRQPASAAALAARLSAGDGFGQPLEIAPGQTLAWRYYWPGVNYGGGDDPGAVDMAGVTFFQNFDVAWGARWIYSDTGQSLSVHIRRFGFVNGSHLSIWMNGESVHAGQLAEAPSSGLPVTLKPGWNALVFQSNNYQVQWQFAVDLAGARPETLRVSIVPPAK
ncbi:MAG: GDSL-type esterase/lipase family protein [Opitutaceae bacterium]|jgi:lysophospholipase L1-like esterase|nr:GDSL-type esterase/lipase family protein [Opitutaceae bacterium]